MPLTKRYRLIWNADTKEIQSIYTQDYGNSRTWVGDGLSCFESNDLLEIKVKINELNLIEITQESV